jgi:hypothetical protein
VIDLHVLPLLLPFLFQGFLIIVGHTGVLIGSRFRTHSRFFFINVSVDIHVFIGDVSNILLLFAFFSIIVSQDKKRETLTDKCGLCVFSPTLSKRDPTLKSI